MILHVHSSEVYMLEFKLCPRNNKHVSSVIQLSWHYQLLVSKCRQRELLYKLPDPHVVQFFNYVSEMFSCLFPQNKLDVRTVAAAAGSGKNTSRIGVLFAKSNLKTTVCQLLVSYLHTVLHSACRQFLFLFLSVENHIVPVNLNTMFDFPAYCSACMATCDGRAGVQFSQTAVVFSLHKATFLCCSTPLASQGYGVLCECPVCLIWPSVKHRNAQMRAGHHGATSQHLDPDGWIDDLGMSKSTFFISAPSSLLASLQYSEVRQMNQSQQLKINQGEKAHLRNCASNLVLHQLRRC